MKASFLPPALVGGVLLCALFGGSCARTPAPPVVSGSPSPSGSASPGAKFLYVTMTVRGRINTVPADATTTGNAYFVLINRSDDMNEGGAVPIVGPPWSNGYAAPARTEGQGFVGVVRYDNLQSSQNGYGVYSITDSSGNLVNPLTLGRLGGTPLGPPDTAVTPQNGQNSGQTLNPGDQNTLSFRLDLSRLPLNNTQYLWINLIATNNLPQGVTDAPKLWDALGDGSKTGTINSAIRLDVTQNPRLLNQNLGTDLREPANDVRDHANPAVPLVDDPDIDIIDYSIEIRPQ